MNSSQMLILLNNIYSNNLSSASCDDITELTKALSFTQDDGSSEGQKRRRYMTRSSSRELRAKLKDLSKTAEDPHVTMMNYSFDPCDYTDAHLIHVGIQIFSYYNLLHIYHINVENLTNFFYCVCSLYNAENHFHNFKHAFGVMHMCFHVLINGAEEYLDSFDIFVLLVSALCHDLGHPGNTNAYELATQTHLSPQYFESKECILERYHASLTRALLLSDGSYTHDLLGALHKDQKDNFFRHVSFIILGTDMAKHTSLVDETKEFVEEVLRAKADYETKYGVCLIDSSRKKNRNGTPRSRTIMVRKAESNSTSSSLDENESAPSLTPKFSFHNLDSLFERTIKVARLMLPEEEERKSLCRLIVHSCDIGAQTQATGVACRWAKRCYAEFRDQVNNEKKLGIVTSSFLHNLDEDLKIFTTQESFIKDTVLPLWSNLILLFPKLQFAVDQLIENQNFYRSLINYSLDHSEENTPK